MIRQRLSLVYVMIFVWSSMIFGLLAINTFLVPLELPGVDSIIIGILKVAISLLLSIIWLWIWRKIVVMIFWRAIREQ